jgi:hypothetical protein
MFTLVNVYSPLAHLSFGYERPPHRKVCDPLAKLNATYAFTPVANYNGLLEPKFKQHRTFLSTIWGIRFSQSRAYMTTSIPHTVMTDAHLQIPNLQEMAWLYMAIGAFSKNFVKKHKFFRNDDDLFLSSDQSHEILFSKYYHKNMPFIFKNVGWDSWVYSKDMWNLAPNSFSERSFNDTAVEYYCRYLAKDFYKQTDAENVKSLEKKAFKMVRSGLLDILSKEIHTSRYTDIVNSMTGHAFIPETINVEETAEKILTGRI